MTFGESVLGELRKRKLHTRLRYADIQALKAVTDPHGMRAFLASRGYEAGEERTAVLHFVDFIEIRILRRSLSEADAAILFFGLT